MTTFTMQDLTTEQQQAVTNHEEMHKMFNDMGTALIQANPTPQDAINNMAIPTTPNPEPIQWTQGGTIGTAVPNVEDIVNTICAQLQLLSTVIKAGGGAGNSLNAEDQSLQECVSLTLKQADWFKDLIRRELIGGGIEDLAKDAVQEVVENEVEHYFEHSFDPSYHFDFDDAVHDAVGDRIDDVVADKIDDALDSYMQNATITISK